MKPRNHITIVLVIIMAMIAFSATVALAAGSDGMAPDRPVHAPVCYQLDTFVPGTFELFCTDTGKDIVDVTVVTTHEYELTWDNETVSLRVYTDGKPDERGHWIVTDKAGSKTFGPLP